MGRTRGVQMNPMLGARARIDVSPADIGRRVTLRYRLDSLGIGHAELVGVLDRWTGAGKKGILRIRQRDGMTQGIEVSQIEAARVIRPEVSAYRLQEIAEAAWPARESSDLGEWTMRWAHGITRRANSCRIGGSPGVPLAQALSQVTQWYAERGGRAVLQMPYPGSYDEDFKALGWVVQRRSIVMENSTARLRTETELARQRLDIVTTISDSPDERWLSLVPEYDSAREELDFIFTGSAATGLSTAFATCINKADGTPLGIGRAVGNGNWTGVTTMETEEHARRRGVATSIMAALADWAFEQRRMKWYLQVYHDSAAALSLYDSLGFTAHHEYVYRWREAT